MDLIAQTAADFNPFLSFAQYGVLGTVCAVMMYALRSLFQTSKAEREQLCESHAAEREACRKEHKEERDEWKREWDAERAQYRQSAQEQQSAIMELLRNTEKRKEG